MVLGAMGVLVGVGEAVCSDNRRVLVVETDPEIQQQLQELLTEKPLQQSPVDRFEGVVVPSLERALEQLEQALQQECPYVVVVVGEGVSTEAEGVAAMRRGDQRALLLFLVSPEAQAASSLQGVMRPGELLLPTPLFRPQAIHLLDHLCG